MNTLEYEQKVINLMEMFEKKLNKEQWNAKVGKKFEIRNQEN